MKKVRLDLDELSVESFSANVEAETEGTVIGHASEDTNCNSACLGTCMPAQCRSVLTGICCPP